jgi:hypothetical protein
MRKHELFWVSAHLFGQFLQDAAKNSHSMGRARSGV